MKTSLRSLLSGILVAVVVLPLGCGSEPDPGPDVAVSATGSPTTTTALPGTSPPSASSPDGLPPTALPPTPTGFPCDVHAVLQNSCANCHAGHLYYGPNFDSRDDLFIAARDLFLVPPAAGVQPGTFGEHMATALRDGTMPPYGATVLPSAADRNLVIGWVAAGMPAGDCGMLTPPR
jgi:hypothetical protein